MTGIGVIIIVLQIFPMLGHTSPGTIVDILKNIGTPLSAINMYALGLALLIDCHHLYLSQNHQSHPECVNSDHCRVPYTDPYPNGCACHWRYTNGLAHDSP
jgi:hypothetical protein